MLTGNFIANKFSAYHFFSVYLPNREREKHYIN